MKIFHISARDELANCAKAKNIGFFVFFEEMFNKRNDFLMHKDAKKVFEKYDIAHRSRERLSNMRGEGL